METAKDTLDRHAKLKGYASYEDMILLGNPFCIEEVIDDALPEIANKAWEASLDGAIKNFEEAKKGAGTLKDIVFLDCALAVLDALKTGKSPDKSTFMKSLFKDNPPIVEPL